MKGRLYFAVFMSFTILTLFNLESGQWNSNHECEIDRNVTNFKREVNTKALSWSDLDNSNITEVQSGGFYKPKYCLPKHKIAILIPLRNREKNLRILLRHIHPFLQRQLLEYKIYVINQTGTEQFNKGATLNVGFIEALNDNPDWDCFIFHDVDLLPEDDRNLYHCTQQPRHLSIEMEQFDYQLRHENFFAGVIALTPKQYQLINGFSNRFWAWGGEDNDLSMRVRKAGFTIFRGNSSTAKFTSLEHKHAKINPQRYERVKEGEKYWNKSGLSDLVYEKMSITEEPLFTHITVQFKGLFSNYKTTLI